MNKKYTETPIFIGGMPKSGTTLLFSLLDGHPEVLTFPFVPTLLVPSLKIKYKGNPIDRYKSGDSGGFEGISHRPIGRSKNMLTKAEKNE